MSFFYKTTILAATLLMAGCEQSTSDTNKQASKQGLPQAQQPQGDSAAGVKFNDQLHFKSLSDDEQ